ncbi:MAG: FtsX-like permease family protein [Cyclobacteriaceae bacterium]
MITDNITPPKLAIRLFRWYCRNDRLEELEGDLLEMHEYRISKGKAHWQLNLLFWWDVISCFKRYAIKTTKTTMNTSLYKSYAKLGFRHAWKNKGPVAINILGLGLSVGFCITVYMIFAYNIEFDSFYEDTDSLYRVHSLRSSNEQMIRYELAPLAMVNHMKSSMGNVEDVFQYNVERATVKLKNEFYDNSIGTVSGDFLKTMNLPLKYGNRAEFGEPNTVFLTDRVAEKYFGDVYPVGEMLTIYLRDNKRIEMKVGGVFERIPLNTSFLFDILINFQTLQTAVDITPNDWASKERVAIYFKSDNPKNVQEQLNGLIELQNNNNKKWSVSSFEVIPFVDDRLADHLMDYSPTNLRIRPEIIIIFAIMGLLILLVATFNITNTSIALVSRRLKEVGVRKTLGGQSSQIFFQFLMEMLIITSGALVIALLIANVFAKEFFGPFGFAFIIADISILRFIPFVILFLGFLTFLSGVIPASYARKFEAMDILNKRYKLKGVGLANRLLTIGQYAFSIAVLTTGISFALNTEYMKNYDYGFDSKDLMVFDLEDQSDLVALENQLSKLSGVVAVTRTKNHHDISRSNVVMRDHAENVDVRAYHVGADYHEEMKIEILAGRSFREKSTADIQDAVIVNQKFVDTYLSGSDPINHVVTLDDTRKTIIGVSEHVYSGVYEDDIPKPEVYLMVEDSSLNRLLVRTASSQSRADIEADLKTVWVSLFESPFGGQWQDQRTGFNAVKDSNNLKKIFLALAGLGCFLSLIGIFSLASINVVQKTKEISIRKVLGASFTEVNMSINRGFSYILLIALFVGSGLGYFISEGILQTIYKYYEGVSILVCFAIGLFVVLSALTFILAATFVPMRANPSKGLRTE